MSSFRDRPWATNSEIEDRLNMSGISSSQSVQRSYRDERPFQMGRYSDYDQFNKSGISSSQSVQRSYEDERPFQMDRQYSAYDKGNMSGFSSSQSAQRTYEDERAFQMGHGRLNKSGVSSSQSALRTYEGERPFQGQDKGNTSGFSSSQSAQRTYEDERAFQMGHDRVNTSGFSSPQSALKIYQDERPFQKELDRGNMSGFSSSQSVQRTYEDERAFQVGHDQVNTSGLSSSQSAQRTSADESAFQGHDQANTSGFSSVQSAQRTNEDERAFQMGHDKVNASGISSSQSAQSAYEDEKPFQRGHNVRPFYNQDRMKPQQKKTMQFLKDYMKRADREPLIGLEHIMEYRIHTKARKMETRYVCELCTADTDLMQMIDHLCGIKHRKLYMAKVYPFVLKSPSNKNEDRVDFIRRMALEIEQEEGTKMYKIDPATKIESLLDLQIPPPTPPKKAKKKSRWESVENETFNLESDAEAGTVTSLTMKLTGALKEYTQKTTQADLFQSRLAKAKEVAVSIIKNATAPVNKNPPVNRNLPVNKNAPMNMIPPMNKNAPMNMIPPMNKNAPMNMIPPMNKNAPMNMIPPMNKNPPVNMNAPMNKNPPVNMNAPMDINAKLQKLSQESVKLNQKPFLKNLPTPPVHNKTTDSNSNFTPLGSVPLKPVGGSTTMGKSLQVDQSSTLKPDASLQTDASVQPNASLPNNSDLEDVQFFKKLMALLAALPQNPQGAGNMQMNPKLMMLKSILFDKGPSTADTQLSQPLSTQMPLSSQETNSTESIQKLLMLMASQSQNGPNISSTPLYQQLTMLMASQNSVDSSLLNQNLMMQMASLANTAVSLETVQLNQSSVMQMASEMQNTPNLIHDHVVNMEQNPGNLYPDVQDANALVQPIYDPFESQEKTFFNPPDQFVGYQTPADVQYNPMETAASENMIYPAAESQYMNVPYESGLYTSEVTFQLPYEQSAFNPSMMAHSGDPTHHFEGYIEEEANAPYSRMPLSPSVVDHPYPTENDFRRIPDDIRFGPDKIHSDAFDERAQEPDLRATRPNRDFPASSRPRADSRAELRNSITSTRGKTAPKNKLPRSRQATYRSARDSRDADKGSSELPDIQTSGLSADILKRIRGKDLFTVSAILSEYAESRDAK
ncbi:uncharacterized protein LOC108714722 isoform X3 [Xenopus laevis]|uniref:Uncharacterized protein LOC108714722 isoform X3 n=1 Tax=Xenopus laevis TaxID=8355 RepID=A0A8J1N0Q9_XENLA|nr:uncharacterized protein LOC108714722 isoform X3 [Xenopus laevis]